MRSTASSADSASPITARTESMNERTAGLSRPNSSPGTPRSYAVELPARGRPQARTEHRLLGGRAAAGSRGDDRGGGEARARLDLDRGGLRIGLPDTAGVVGREDRADQARHGDRADVGAAAGRDGHGRDDD